MEDIIQSKSSEPNHSVTAQQPMAKEMAKEMAWRQLVDKTLKGAAFESLISKSADGIEYGPLYGAADSILPITRRLSGGWKVAQRIDVPEVEKAQSQIIDDFTHSVEIIELVEENSPHAYGFGLKLADPTHLKSLLAGIEVDRCAWRLTSKGLGMNAASNFVKVAADFGLPPQALRLDCGCNLMGEIIAKLPETSLEPLIRWAIVLYEKGFTGRVFLADGRSFQAAGASEAQELASVLASGVETLRQCVKHGFDLPMALAALDFTLSANANQFFTMAKFRAMRLLWARVEEACGIEIQPINLHGQSSWQMMTRDDCSVNILRTTMAAIAAGLGGADSFTVLPFTQAVGLPEAKARRLARNSQLIALAEAHLGEVDDPGAGSGALEYLTEALCEKAWELFQDIEAAGGMKTVLLNGSWPKLIAQKAQAKRQAIANRLQPLTGVSEFALPIEQPGTVICPIPTHLSQGLFACPRLSEPYEALRERARRLKRPARLFLANLGSASSFIAQASFATSLYGAGGITAIANDGFTNGQNITDMAALIAAAEQSGARLVCICGADDAYKREAITVATCLKQPGRRLSLVGDGGDLHMALQQKAVDGFIFHGCDALQELDASLTFLESHSS